MAPLDWAIIGLYLVVVTFIGFYFLRRASGSTAEYFVAGRNLPWWIAGTSLIATSFAADTPLAITGIVAKHGIAGNWLWWNQVIVWMLAVVFFARLWRRSGLVTDAEFVELRYGGTAAAFLRGFRACYMSVVISTVTLAWVMLAMQKIVSATLAEPEWVANLEPQVESMLGMTVGTLDLWKWIVLIVLFFVATLYTVVSGYWGIVVTDLVQFVIAMAGSIIFSIYAVAAVGGVSGLHARLAEQFGAESSHDLLSFFPAMDSPWMPVTAFAVYLGVLWWGDCNGFAAQRMFSVRSDRDSTLTALWYSIGHFVLRPWPWILVALVTLVYYPNLEDREAGYPMLMMEILPVGVRGLMVASLLAAFMSTVDTHLNWNASYFVTDVFKRFIMPHATERQGVMAARLSTIGFAALAIVFAYTMTSIEWAWLLLFNLNAGIGLVIMLRWFWWRINAWSEITAMAASIAATPAVRFISDHYQLEWSGAHCILATVVISSISWITVTFLTSPTDASRLEEFYRRVRPPQFGWGWIAERCPEVQSGDGSLLGSVWAWVAGAIGLTVGMFGVGLLVLGYVAWGVGGIVLFIILMALAYRHVIPPTSEKPSL